MNLDKLNIFELETYYKLTKLKYDEIVKDIENGNGHPFVYKKKDKLNNIMNILNREIEDRINKIMR